MDEFPWFSTMENLFPYYVLTLYCELQNSVILWYVEQLRYESGVVDCEG